VGLVAAGVVLLLAIGSWIAGDLARNYAIGKLQAENGLIALQVDAKEREVLEWQAIAHRRVDPALRKELAASSAEFHADLRALERSGELGQDARSIEEAHSLHDRAVARELAAIDRGQIQTALKIDEEATDPAAALLSRRLIAARMRLEHNSDHAAWIAGLLGWMKALAAAAAAVFLVRLALTARARGLRAETEREVLAELNQRLLEVDRIRDDLIATVSHELRTPLTSIRGYLELIDEEESGLSEEGRTFLGVIERNAVRLEHVVTDLLFIAQVDANRLELEFAPFPPQELVADAVSSARPFAESQGIELHSRVDEVPPLLGDRARLAQLLDNLISNALKFTPRGGRVEVRLWCDAAGSMVLEVADTGMGIVKAEQVRLFERFYRTSSATESAIAGTGLGLSIVKITAEAHGGTVSLDSEEGRGTTFRVVLPLAAQFGPAPA
jgi:signal transduction histidine kinase